MFDSIFSALNTVTPEQQVKLDELNAIKQELAQEVAALQRFREAGNVSEDSIGEYLELHMKPLVLRAVPIFEELMPQVIDIDRLKDMMPMIGMALLPSVNVALLVQLLGLNTDSMKFVADLVKRVMRSGETDA